MMPSVADCVVIGAGITGLSVAFQLAQLGYGRIVVVEREQPGCGATARSGGIVRTHYVDEAEIALAAVGLHWYQHWDELVGGNCGFTRTGLLVIAPQEQRALMERTVDKQRGLGIDASMITAESAVALDASLVLPEWVTHVAYEPGAGTAEPALAIRQLATAAIKLGVAIETNTHATGVTSSAGRVLSVVTDKGTVSTRTIVMAAGARANPLLASLDIDLGLRPARARVSVFSMPPARQWPHPVYLDHIQRSWFRPMAGGSTMVGIESGVLPTDGHEQLAAEPDGDQLGVVDGEFASQCARVMTERFPSAEYAAFRGGWSGLFMESPDQRPVLGQLPPYDGLFAVAGDSGTSFKTAPAIGIGIAELIVGATAPTVDISAFGMNSRMYDCPPSSGYTAMASVSR